MKKFLLVASFLSLLLVGRFAYAMTNATQTPTAKEQMEERRQEKEDLFLQRKEQLASKAAMLRDRFRTKREAFRERLATLKDQNKEKIIERVDTRIDTLNKKHTERLESALEKMNEILGKLEEKVASAGAQGKNTASASAAITTARNAVNAAQTAVSDQSGKDYAPTLEDETTLGKVMSQTVTIFHSDLQSVHKLVVDAKQAVKKAAVAVYQL